MAFGDVFLFDKIMQKIVILVLFTFSVVFSGHDQLRIQLKQTFCKLSCVQESNFTKIRLSRINIENSC